MLLSGVLAAAPIVTAQQPAVQLVAQVQQSQKSKLRRIHILAPVEVAKGEFLWLDEGADAPVSMKVKDFKFFFIETPKDLAEALRDYSADDLDARKQLSKVRAKYAAFAGLPGNPATFAGLMEVSCAARAMDWKALDRAVGEFPSPRFLDAAGREKLAAARVLSKVSDDPATAAARQKEVEEVLKAAVDPTKASSEVYTWLKYALGRALASNIPASELQKGISSDNVPLAGQAIDAYCEAVAAAHGRYMEIPIDAMHRAFRILWAMPGVKDFAAKAGKLDKKSWNAAPYNFRDAVVMAYLLRNVYASELKDEAITKAAEFYVNPFLGAKASPQKTADGGSEKNSPPAAANKPSTGKSAVDAQKKAPGAKSKTPQPKPRR